ncbi:MAG: HEAT repeat domain-containing protein [Elusimicrobiota bacterium]
MNNINNKKKSMAAGIFLWQAVIISLLICAGIVPVVSAEYELLKSTDPVVRMSEVLRLGSERNQEAIPYLIDVLGDESENVRLCAVIALGEIVDEAAIAPIISVLENDASEGVKVIAAQTLGRFRGAEVRKALLAACDSENDRIRAAAVRSLGKAGKGKDVDKILEKVSEDKNWRVRKNAANALANIVELERGDKGKRKDIEKALKRAGRRDKDKRVKDAAGNAGKRLEGVPEKEE